MGGRTRKAHLYTRDGAQNEDGTVKHTESTLDLDGEVDVTCRGR